LATTFISNPFLTFFTNNF